MHSFVKIFPKADRHTIGQKMMNLALETMELLFLANSKQNQAKILILNKVDVKLKILKILARMAFDLKIIDFGKYLLLETQLAEIGRMLGGWIKSVKKQNPAG